MQDKIFKVKIFEVLQKSSKFVKIFSLEIFRLYGVKTRVHNKRNPVQIELPSRQQASAPIYSTFALRVLLLFLE